VGEIHPHELLITLFVFITAPVAAHLLVKAALAVSDASATSETGTQSVRLESPPRNEDEEGSV